MDHRNREARRSSMVASTNNGLSRRRHRPNSLRDSPDEDGAVEFSESVRLRERVKKDRDRGDRDRERERERERERSSRSSKRRRGERLMLGSDRGGDDSSQESNNDDDDDEDDENNHHHHSNGGGSGGVRMLPPNPSTTTAAAAFPNHHHHSLQHRKTFPPSTTNISRAAAPVWKPGDEMIGVSVPRKARTAHTKRSHDWISSSSGGAVISGGGGGGGVGDQNHRQASTSPVRNSVVSTSSPAAPPLSPSSSNASGRKKIKANGRPPKTSSKSNPEELEIEIAEVLYGLMTQSQAPPPPPPRNDSSRQQVNNNRSRVSSPLSNSQSPPILPTNSNSSTHPFSAIAPKRKRPRQVSENQSRESATAKAEMDQSMTMKAEVSSPPHLEKTTTPVENGATSFYASTNSNSTIPSDPVPESIKVDSETKPPQVDEMVGKEEATSPQKESAEDGNRIGIDSTPASTTKPLSVPEVESHREEKIQIDLMAPPPQLRSSPSPEGEGEVNFGFTSAEPKKVVSDSIYSVSVEAEEKAKAAIVEETESKKRIVVDGKGRDIDLQLDLAEKIERDNSGCANNKSQQPSQQQQQQQQPPPLKEEQNTEKPILGQSSSLPLPMSMSMASWSGGLPPMGYMAPLQGVVTMDGSAIPPTPLQSIFSQPRPKRCATHCYIARNIHLLQQFMKMNPFWPPPPPPPTASTSASLFGGSKPCNLSVVPAATEFNGRAGPDKGLAIFPGLAAGKEKGCSQPPIPDNNPAQRKQQHILLQQPLPPPVAPNNLLPGHTFIFPINQQQAATAAPRPGAAKSPVASSNVVSNSGAGGNASTTGGAVSFSYPPNMPPNETTTPYLAILQNNAYFPIPAVGAPLNYRGGHAHAQPLPLFNGSFYSPQMIHHPPPQLQQQQQQQQSTNSQSKQNTSMSSGSSSSHKQHLQNHQKQQRPQGNTAVNVNGSTGSGNLLHNFPPASKTLSSSQPQNQHIRHIENELGSEDSPSTTAESRGGGGGSRPPMNVYNQSYVMQIHPSNFGMMAPPPATSANQSEKKPALKTGGLESSMPPQPFAMSFASISGASSTPGIDISSSMGQSHAIFQSLPEATRQNLHIVAAAAQAQAQAAQHKKCYRDDTRSGSGDPTDDERKKVPGTTSSAGGGQQSIAFSRPDLTDGSKMASNNNVIDSSRSISLAAASGGPTGWTARAVVPNSMGTVVSNAQLHAQLQQQMVQQLHKQQQQQHQQQQLAATAVSRSSKAAPPPTSNGIVYSEQHLTSSGAKFSNSFPQNLVQASNNNNSHSPSQSPQWKSSAKTSCAASQPQSSLASATSSLKNLTQQQQQQLRAQQNHTQISFSANQKSTPSQGGQQHNQSQPMAAGSPTTSSISKGAGGSPRTATTASMSSKTDPTPSQQGKASMSSIPNQKSSPASGRNVPSILGNQHNISSSGSKTQMQQQQQQQHLQKGSHQSQLFFSGSYAQPQQQSTSTSPVSATSGYYIQRRRPEQQQQQAQQPASSSGMLTLCPVTLGDPAKAIAAAAAASSNNSNMRGGSFPSQTILHATQFSSQSSGNQHHILPTGFPYVHVPAAVQVKPTEQKQQPAGNDNLQACWQPEKK